MDWKPEPRNSLRAVMLGAKLAAFFSVKSSMTLPVSLLMACAHLSL